ALDPQLLVIGTHGAELSGRRKRGGAGEDEGPGKRQRAVAQSPDEAIAVAIQRARRAVHHDDAVGLERHELLRRERALAHVEVELRRGKAALLDLELRGLDGAPATGLEQDRKSTRLNS